MEISKTVDRISIVNPLSSTAATQCHNNWPIDHTSIFRVAVLCLSTICRFQHERFHLFRTSTTLTQRRADNSLHHSPTQDVNTDNVRENTT